MTIGRAVRAIPLAALLQFLAGCSAEPPTESGTTPSDEVIDVGKTTEAITQGSYIVRTLQPGQNLSVSFPANPGYRTTLMLNSGGAGNWRFRAVYTGLLGVQYCANGDTGVFTYWSEGGGFNYWPGGGVVCYPISTINTMLHSGSSAVKYMIYFDHYGDYGIGVRADFTAQ